MIVESRTLVYLEHQAKQQRILKRSIQPDFQSRFTPTPISLFRFSAITFNSHLIHYNLRYCRQEGYHDLVVHGPFTVSLLMNLLHDQGIGIESFEYKCIGPAYVNQELTLNAKLSEDGYLLWATNPQGSVIVKGTAKPK